MRHLKGKHSGNVVSAEKPNVRERSRSQHQFRRTKLSAQIIQAPFVDQDPRILQTP